MKTAIKHESDEFLVITLKHVSGLKVEVNSPRTKKLWEIAHENNHKPQKLRVLGHISQTENYEFLVISLKHVTGLTGHANSSETQKIWAITHDKG